MSKRAEQIAEVIQHEMNDFFMREVEFPSDVLVTLTAVQVTPDLKHALVYLSILPITKTGSVLKIIEKTLGRAKHFISQKLKLRKCPELKITVDDFALKNRQIEKALEELKTPKVEA